MKKRKFRYGLKNNAFVKWTFVPLLLLLFWFTATGLHIFYSDLSPSVLSENHRIESYKTKSNLRLLKNNYITGQIKAKDNYLGILSIRFEKTNNPVDDIIVFRIREVGAKNWYFQNSYNSEQFFVISLYPFGFPIIENSKNRIYEFQLISLYGSKNNSIKLSQNEPVIISKYKFPRRVLFSNTNILYDFISDKIIYTILNANLFFLSLIYLFPFIFYILLQASYKIHNKISKTLRKIILPPVLKYAPFLTHPSLLIIFFAILVDIFIISSTYDDAFLVLGFLWIALVVTYGMKSKNSFFVCFFLAIVFQLLLIFNQEMMAEKSANWLYLFFILALVHSFLELRPRKKV